MRLLQSIVVVTAMGVVAVGPALSAGAQSPSTCLAEVDGAQFDDSVDFAGRVRPWAGEDGAIVTRSLLCPYVAEDGRATELILEWDEQSLGRFRCESDELVLEDGDPTRARLDHPDRQAAVLLRGQVPADVRAMEGAARIALDAVPGSAAPCSEGAAAASPPGNGRGGLFPIAVVVAVLISSVALIVLVLRRRRLGAATGIAGRTLGAESSLARHLVLGSGSRPLDVIAAAAVIAHVRGRPELVGIAATAHGSLAEQSREDPHGPRRQLAGRILEATGDPTDGSTTAVRGA